MEYYCFNLKYFHNVYFHKRFTELVTSQITAIIRIKIIIVPIIVDHIQICENYSGDIVHNIIIVNVKNFDII